jgi:hypothetical protein
VLSGSGALLVLSGNAPAARRPSGQGSRGGQERVGEREEVIPGGNVGEDGLGGAALPGTDERGPVPGSSGGFDVALGVHHEPGLGRLVGPRLPGLLEEADSRLSACAPHIRGMRAHVEAIERPTQLTIQRPVDLVQGVHVELPPAHHRLVRDHQQPVPGVTEQPGGLGRSGLDLQLLETLHGVTSVDVEHSVTIEENYPVANLNHSSVPVERFL